MFRVFVIVPVLLLTIGGCHRIVRKTLKSSVSMTDLDSTHQLVSGFYDLEGKSWRWTARQFVITFPGSKQGKAAKNCTLSLQVFVPDSQIQKLGPLTLKADVNGTILDGETFNGPGVYTYSRTVPELALESNIVPVVFFLDKSTPAASADGRELGLVVNGAQLTVN